MCISYKRPMIKKKKPSLLGWEDAEIIVGYSALHKMPTETQGSCQKVLDIQPCSKCPCLKMFLGSRSPYRLLKLLVYKINT